MKGAAARLLVLSLILTTTGSFFSYAENADSEISADRIYGEEVATASDASDNTADSANSDEIIPDPAVTIDDIGYSSINQAIKEVKKGTLVVQRDITEDVVIPADAEVEIDLNGYTWTNESSHTIINRGTLVISNSNKEGLCTVDNITDQKAAIWNEADGDITIEANCLITRSKETGISFSIKGDNSYNTIINQGSLTIGEGASVTQGPGGGGYSHLISNGWRSGAEDSSDNTASVTIYGGTLSGGLTNIENYHFGVIYIYDGTFEDAEYNSICNYNIADIEGGTFSTRAGKNSSVVYNRQRNDNTAIGKLNIKGGSFTGNIQNVAGSTEVTGGTYTNSVSSELIPYGYTCKRTDDGNYIVTEGQSSGEASMSIGASASDIISAGASKKETETVQLIVSNILSNNVVNASKVSGLNSAFNVSKFLSSSVGSSLNATSENDIELYVTANLTKVELKEKPGIQSTGEESSLVPASMTYEAYPTVKGRGSSGDTESVSLQSNSSQFLSGENIQFKLPVSSLVTESYVKITHESEGYENEVSYSKILGTGAEKYTTVSCSHFSTFVLEFTESIPAESNNSGSDSDSDDSEMDSIKITTTDSGNRGTWKQDERGWWFRRNDGSWPRSEWLECVWNGVLSWYYFNSEGYVSAGWFTDTDGQRYFLHDQHDGKFGYMYTGWNQIGESWYYFNTETGDGRSKGSLLMNGMTPDGYEVGEDGAWVQ